MTLYVNCLICHMKGEWPVLPLTSTSMAVVALPQTWIALVVSLNVVILGSDSAEGASAVVHGLGIASVEKTSFEDGHLVVTADRFVPIRLFGNDLSANTSISFTQKNATKNKNCDDLRSTDTFTTSSTVESKTSAVVIVKLAHNDGPLFMCVKNSITRTTNNQTVTDMQWVHQGASPWMQIFTKSGRRTMLPLWLQVIVVLLLLCLSGLFSGLNLGLMSLDKTELQIVESVGSPKEQKYAKKISPVRKRGNFLLCTILLGNVLVNNTLTILLDDLTGSGAYAVVGATAGIVVFGEIIPQAVCSRHGLAIGAKTILITKFFMVLTFVVAYPISKVLDCILGEEIGNVYNRDRLRELLKLTKENIDLVNDEVNIIAGALELSRKTVRDVMTKLDDVFMVEINRILDFDTMSEIMKTGYTRIPVYEKEKTNIVALLNIKDLAFVDPDDKTPLRTVLKFYNHPVNFVFEDTKLDSMLEEFKKGRSHLSFVQRVNNEGDGDPFYETLGVVTLEDVIEEIIQSEIVDETDTVSDNRVKRRRTAQVKDFSVFNQPDDEHYPRMSPQLALATFQYLSTSVDVFKFDLISDTVLHRLIQQNVIVNIRFTDNPEDNLVFRQGKPCDFFCLILQGRVEVNIGKESMIFEGGPFMYFGLQALQNVNQIMERSHANAGSDSIYLKSCQYVPDFTVKALTDLQILKIRRTHYIAARRATMMERQPKSPAVDITEDQFAKEWKRAVSVQNETGTADNESKINSPSSADTTSLSDEQSRARSTTQDSIGLLEDVKVDTPLMRKNGEEVPGHDANA